MTAWIGIVISVLGIVVSTLLEKEKIARLYADFFSWQEQRKHRKAGEEFIKKISQPKEKGDDSLFVVFIPLFFVFTIGSGFASLLNAKTIQEVGFVGALTLSFILWLSLRDLAREAAKRNIEWYVTLYMFVMFQVSVISLGFIWSFFTMIYIYEDLPIFWAGMAGTVSFLVTAWLILFLGKRVRGA